MSVAEKLQETKFVVDAEGNKAAAIIDYALCELLLEMLEDAEDADELRRRREAGEESLSWEEAKAELRADGVDYEEFESLQGLLADARDLIDLREAVEAEGDEPGVPLEDAKKQLGSA